MALPAPAPGTTILITGASSGIGTDLARELARRGYGLTLVARRRERMETLAAELTAKHDIVVDVQTCDLSDAGARAELLAGLTAPGATPVVGVCSNAGFGTIGDFKDLDLAREVEEVRLNVSAAHEIAGTFVVPMIERGAGAILMTASVAAFQPIPRMATYAATKAFVLSFSEALHSELAGTGVSCTALCPGPVKTEFNSTAGVEEQDGPSIDFLVQVPAQEVAAAAVRGMVEGRRSVIPGLGARTLATAGRLTPRTLLLPLTKLVGAERILD